jgi:hypothetical protein
VQAAVVAAGLIGFDVLDVSRQYFHGRTMLDGSDESALVRPTIFKPGGRCVSWLDVEIVRSRVWIGKRRARFGDGMNLFEEGVKTYRATVDEQLRWYRSGDTNFNRHRMLFCSTDAR